MEYIVNVFLDKEARLADDGSRMAAHLWFKQMGHDASGWIPVADPTHMNPGDTVRFTIAHVYMNREVKDPTSCRVLFSPVAGTNTKKNSPLAPGVTDQLKDNTYPWETGRSGEIAGMEVDVPYVITEPLPLENDGSWEFSVEVGDADGVRYSLDPRMDVGP